MKEISLTYKEIQPKIYAFFYIKTSNPEIAEDLTQDVFYAACKGYKSFARNSTIQTWLFSIAKNLLKKHYRSKRYNNDLKQTLLSEPIHNSQSPEDLFLLNEETNELIQCILKLEDLPKEIVVLRIYGELTFKEIGQLVDQTENYVRVTFHRTKLKLQREMEAKR